MREHLDFCGQMARADGNDRFERPEPYDQVLYVVDNHDRGWDDYDVNPGLDPEHRPALSDVATPAVASVKTNRGSPDFNETHHPYCGLLSSMHTWVCTTADMGSVNLWCGPPEHRFDHRRRP